MRRAALPSLWVVMVALMLGAAITSCGRRETTTSTTEVAATLPDSAGPGEAGTAPDSSGPSTPATPPPPLARARERVLERVEGSDVELAIQIHTARDSFPLVVVATKDETDEVTAIRAFIFLGGEPTEIARGAFRRDEDANRPDLECRGIRLLRLGATRDLPAALAVGCDYGGDTIFRYALLDEGNLAAPVVGEAIWSTSQIPTARHEAFVPNDDPDLTPGLSEHRGDGKTVLEGREGRRAGAKESPTYSTRTFRAAWDGKQLVYTYGAWESD